MIQDTTWRSDCAHNLYSGSVCFGGSSSIWCHLPRPPKVVPFGWEEKPGLPKGHVNNSSAASSNYGDAEEELDDKDFAFDFSGQLERDYLPADELFDGGKIKPLKPPPRFQYDQSKSMDNNSSPKSPRSTAQIIREAFSPRSKSNDFDPFTAALEQTRRETVRQNAKEKRGRERTRSRNSRSLSPYRVSDLLFEPNPVQEPVKNPSKNPQFSSSSSFSSFWYKKWKIKDLLLFRSASESRAKDKEEEMKKYDLLKKPGPDDDVKNSSFRSTESVGSGSSRRKSGPSISAHELHYTINRRFSEEMKKRSFLPYKQGLLGCLGFHPTVPDISGKGTSPTGSLSRG
ncbi:hypothetical protein CASFOL_042263 [Castilleja foliolosa]|uniref:Uncharacterized protein n=1 Tax=Castilleja foliolosa TaxID=1961234 RepID=A0ABD3BA93_9LAMI